MALLTHSETLAFNGFLSSIDFGDSLEWSGISPESIPLIPPQGKEALAKATKDLMALEPNLHASDAELSSQRQQPPVRESSSWPSFRNEQQDQPQHGYTYGFAVQSSSRQPPHRSIPPNGTGEQHRSLSQDIFGVPRSQSHRPFDNSSATSSTHLAFSSSPGSQAQGTRPSHYAATSSAPSMLHRSASSSKRSLLDVDWQGSSSASAKRRRPSVVSQRRGSASPNEKPFASSLPRSTRASSVSSSTTAAGTPREGEPSSSSNAKPALLSPSQKRANHIQSEQKRRANIRKGYEALCEAVPALRDAIRVEEDIGTSEICLRTLVLSLITQNA